MDVLIFQKQFYSQCKSTFLKIKSRKNRLLDRLSSDFYKLLEMMTISRSGKYITSYYGTKNIGKFPNKNKPENYSPEMNDFNFRKKQLERLKEKKIRNT